MTADKSAASSANTGTPKGLSFLKKSNLPFLLSLNAAAPAQIVVYAEVRVQTPAVRQDWHVKTGKNPQTKSTNVYRGKQSGGTFTLDVTLC